MGIACIKPLTFVNCRHRCSLIGSICTGMPVSVAETAAVRHMPGLTSPWPVGIEGVAGQLWSSKTVGVVVVAAAAAAVAESDVGAWPWLEMLSWVVVVVVVLTVTTESTSLRSLENEPLPHKWH